MIEMVFLDAGETILHPHPSFAELFAQICARRGRVVTAAQVEAIQQALAPHLVDLAEDTGVAGPSLSAEGSETFWTYLYRRFLRELGIEDEELVAELYERFSSSASYRLFDDVLPALDELSRAGLRLGLISNFEGWLEEMLVELEVGHLFDPKVISGTAGVEKPDPRIYEIALEEAGVAAGSCLHVGDSPVLDVDPARLVGMRAVLLDRFGRYPHVDVVAIGSLGELPDVVAAMSTNGGRS